MSDKKYQVKDHLSRVPGSTPFGTALWYIGRGADAPIQYLLFSRGLAVSAATTLGFRGSNILIKIGPGAGGLGPVPTLLTGLYAVAALRQIYWLAFTHTYEWPFLQSVQVVLYNLSVDTFNTISAVSAISNTAPILTGNFVDALGWKQWAGIGMFVAGILIETISESTRTAFKKDPKNKRKVDNTGLWSVVRHPNYAGYALWRSGITLAGGSVGAAVGFFLFQTAMFLGQSIPGLVGHMSERHGEQWVAYEKRVPYKLFPGII